MRYIYIYISTFNLLTYLLILEYWNNLKLIKLLAYKVSLTRPVSVRLRCRQSLWSRF